MTFRNLKYKGFNFYGNSKATPSGALAYVIQNKKEDEKVIHLHKKKQGRIYGSVKEDDILKLMEENNGLYEVLVDYPKKIYFDIDGDPNTTNLEEIEKIINEHFPNCKMSISGYETEKRYSYHIILNNYIIKNEKELEDLKLIVKYFYSLNSNFDWKVYTKNRNMKCINQAKIGGEIQKKIKDENIKNHLICSFIPEDYLTIPKIIFEKPEVEHLKNKEYNPVDYSTLPKLDLTLPDNIDLKNPLDLLKITPISPEFDHKYTHKVARFCYYNDLTFNNFISWYKNKSNDKKNIDKWVYHWKRLGEFPSINIRDYINFLKVFYPKLECGFFNNWDLSKEEIKKVKSLNQEHFKTDKKALVINIGMGGGKTTQTIDYLKNKNFCWITPNISLADNTYKRIKDKGIICNVYNSAKNKKEKAELIETSKNILICLNSLFYIKKNYDIVVIDEIETFLKLFYNNETIKQLNEVWENFVNLLINSKKIILLDAFISKMTLNFLNSLNINFEIIQRDEEINNRKAVILPKFNYWICDIIKQLKNNKKLIIFYPYKKKRVNLPSMENLKETIGKLTGKKGIYHNAEASDKNNKKLKNVNKHWKEYDFVISNNKINVGLNFDLSHFNMVYLSIAGFNSPRDIIQFSYRARKLKDNLIKFVYLDKYNSFTGFDIEHTAKYDNIFQSLGEDVSTEKLSPLIETFEFFLYKAGYKINNKIIYDRLNEKIKFLDDDYYNYDKIDDYEKVVIDELEKRIYSSKSTTMDKLIVKKYYFKKMFKTDTDNKILGELWNKNKFNFIEKVKRVLYSDNVINRLKNYYNWSLWFPDEIDKKFKLQKEDLQEIFQNFKFKDLTMKSKHHLILKTFMNTYYGQQLIVSTKTTKKNEYTFKINDKVKNCFILIQENLKEQIKTDDIDLFEN